MKPAEHLQPAQRIDLDRARQLFEQRAAAFVDVRGPWDFERSHVPGAISAPLLELPRYLSAIPRDRPVVVY